jgi:hypothetical protein
MSFVQEQIVEPVHKFSKDAYQLVKKWYVGKRARAGSTAHGVGRREGAGLGRGQGAARRGEWGARGRAWLRATPRRPERQGLCGLLAGAAARLRDCEPPFPLWVCGCKDQVR